jgi:2-polyprenyl-6-methoxyphenol hydroxylase-like FAD-dependent oxidoreductase
MKLQKICIIGDGLAGLTTAAILSKQNLSIDLYSGIKKKNQNIDNRTTAISESNFQYIQNLFNFPKASFFWKCKKIKLYLEEKKKIINFLNFDKKNQNPMYIFQNKNLKNKLKKIIYKKRNIKLIKKNIEEINGENSCVEIEEKKYFYDLIILSTGSFSKFYSKIEAGRSIKKNYKEIAITATIKHKEKIDNACQFFLKEGPLAILPFQKFFFSLVWSVDNSYFEKNKLNLKKILLERLNKLLNIKKNKNIRNIKHIQSFPINLDLKTKYFKKNILILGDGLHAVHPMAGQGFNLVLRDIKKLSELMLKISRLGLDLKNSFLLNDFYKSRKPENNLFGIGIDLTNFFFKDNKVFFPLKKKILRIISGSDFLKKITHSVADKGISY